HVIRAQIALSRKQLADAREECKKVLGLVGNDQESMRNMVGEATAILGSIDVEAGNAASGAKACQEGATLATSDHEAEDTRLMLAHALVESGDARNGLVAANQVREIFIKQNRTESEWRASLIAARANDRLGNQGEVQAQLSRARTALENIQR